MQMKAGGSNTNIQFKSPNKEINLSQQFESINEQNQAPHYLYKGYKK